MARLQNHVPDDRSGRAQRHPYLNRRGRRPSRRRRRWTLLAAIALALTGGGLLIGHERHLNAEAALQTLRKEGLAAHAAGDDAAAVARLDRYFAAHEADVQSLLAFGLARANVPSPDGGHLRRAANALLTAERLSPNSAAVRNALLSVLPRTADTDTLDRVADDALALNPTDPAGLRARMTVRLRQDRPQDALDAAHALASAAPLDLDAHLTVLQTMERLARPAAAMAAYAESAFAPADPRRQILRAAAAVQSDPRHALVTLRRLAATPTADAEVLRQSVALFDLLGRPDLSRDFLATSAGRTNDAGMIRMLATRLWQCGDVATLADAAAPLDGRDPQLVALHAAGLYGSSRFDEARAVVGRLAERRDRVSAAWAVALPARFESPSPIGALQKASDACPDDAVLQTWLADALAEAGEPVLAVPHYAAAAAAEPAWPAPLFGKAAAQVATGDLGDAVLAAQTAYDRRPDADAAVRLIDVRFAAYDRTNDPAAARDLLSAVDAVQAVHAGEPRTLAVRLRLLARLGRRDEAAAVRASVPGVDLKTVARPVALAAAEELDDTPAIDAPTTPPADATSIAIQKRQIDHLRALAGDDGRQWRLARGRMLSDSPDAGEVFDAVTLLGDLVYETPHQTAPRLALVHALERAGNATGAIEHAKLAVRNDPNDPAALTELVRLLRLTNRPADAADAVRRASLAALPVRTRAVVDRLGREAGVLLRAGDVVSVDGGR